MRLRDLLESDDNYFSDLTESDLELLSTNSMLLTEGDKYELIKKQFKLIFGIDSNIFLTNTASSVDTYNIALDKIDFSQAKPHAPIIKRNPDLVKKCSPVKSSCFKLIRDFLMKVKAFNTFDFSLSDDILIMKPSRI